MSFQQIYNSRPLTISCELFPPKTERGLVHLMENVRKLMKFRPDYLTCTYGAGGSDRDRTLSVLRSLKSEFQVPVASHLTCVGSHVDDLRRYLDQARQLGVEYIVALRGDPPGDAKSFEPQAGGLRYANELVELIRREYPSFGVAVAGYPEVHQEAVSPEIDLENLKRKVDCGADVVITQLFFDNEDFYRFRDRCRAAGLVVPIVPGIMPITTFRQIERIASLCGAKLPKRLVDSLSQQDDAQWQFQVGVEQSINQIADLIDQGVDGLHFYVLNKSDAMSAILQAFEITSRLPVRMS